MRRRATAPSRCNSPFDPVSARGTSVRSMADCQTTVASSTPWSTCCVPATRSGCRSTAVRARSGVSRRVSEAALRRVAPHKVRWQQLSADARRRLLEPVVSPEFHGTFEPAAPAPPATTRRATTSPAPAKPRRVLEVRLVRGTIVDANARALVLGVFRNVDPTGPAAAIDAVLDGAVRELSLRRMFAGQLGQVFVLPVARNRLLAEFVLFAGLGDFDDFGSELLRFRRGEHRAHPGARADRGRRHGLVRRRLGRAGGDGRRAAAARFRRRRAARRPRPASCVVSRSARPTRASMPRWCGQRAGLPQRCRTMGSRCWWMKPPVSQRVARRRRDRVASQVPGHVARPRRTRSTCWCR